MQIENNNTLAVVVLCGGHSTRMGKDKGLIKSDTSIWAEKVGKLFTDINLQVYYSINNNQLENYLQHFNNDQLIIDEESIAINGPLKGLLSAHLHLLQQDIFLIACDMIDMHQNVIKELLSIHSNNNADAYVFMNDEEPEPLCGIYTSSLLSKVFQQYQNNNLQKHSMKSIVYNANTFKTILPANWKDYFKNYNTL